MIIPILIFISASLSTSQKPPQSTLSFRPSGDMIPHPLKIEKGGEDAYFMSRQMLVVADGVGGWNNHGIDPGLYSKFLCAESERQLSINPQQSLAHPQTIIKSTVSKNKNLGSSTMSVVTLLNNTLRSCHIGDCKLFVFRRYKGTYHLIYQSTDQLHGFNFPFQLGLPENGGDDPSHAICTELTVVENDLVVLASDGFSDNIFGYQLLKYAEEYYRKGILADLPKELTKIATIRALDRTGDSPFAAKAREWGVEYVGGKVDDTTVIVTEIVKDQEQL